MEKVITNLSFGLLLWQIIGFILFISIAFIGVKLYKKAVRFWIMNYKTDR
jgi:uncharacterized phage infection (PIP) family protein YhgE